MSKAIIYVFSGTGNTLTAAKMIAGRLDKLGYKTDVYRVAEPFSAVPDPNDYDLAGFGYPIHAFNTPQFMLRFVRKLLPATKNKPAFIFKTSGEPFKLNGASSYWLNMFLRRKGFLPTGDTHLLMPYNIMFRYRDSLAKQMYLHTERMSERVAKRALSDTKRLRYNPLLVVLSAVLRLQWFGAWINGPMIHAKKDKCVRCGLCAANCPAGNISLTDKKVKFGWKCTMCMNCAMSCPADAVRPGFLNPWRVNPKFDFKKLLADESVPSVYVDENTTGYFKLFRKYYRETELTDE